MDSCTASPVSVVTGANSGIGRATAIHLAGKGHTVYGTVRATSQDRQAAGDVGAMPASRCTSSSSTSPTTSRCEAGFAEILERAGRVDHLVNNAGIGGNGVVEETPPSTYLDVMNVNLCGAVRCIQAVLPQMRERGSGTIVNVTSITGRIAAIAQQPYVASKWAFEGRQRGTRPGAGSVRHPRGDRRAGCHEVGDLRQVDRRPRTRPAPTTLTTGRMFQFYAAGIASATDPFEVAEVDPPRDHAPTSRSSATT